MRDFDKLQSVLRQAGSVIIAYSGGVDSTFLAKVATDVLGDNALCVLIESKLVPQSETEKAIDTANELGLRLERIHADVLSMKDVPDNTADRCYYCKKAVFSTVIEIARERGIACVMDGANANDESDYRPGSRAAIELGIKSPLKELGFTKERIRSLSRELDLPTWSQPSYACLASRIPYGTPLTEELLSRVEHAEDVLRQLGFGQFRVRHHGDVARIELMPLEMEKILAPAMRFQIIREFKRLGYHYVSLDLAGYRTGSLNEVL